MHLAQVAHAHEAQAVVIERAVEDTDLIVQQVKFPIRAAKSGAKRTSLR